MRVRKYIIFVLLTLLAVSVLFVVVWRKTRVTLPEYIAYGNGRLEAEEIHVASKSGGRVERVYADEGETVGEGQLLAQIDTAELRATLSRAEANLAAARQAVSEARAKVYQKRSDLRLARQELIDAQSLFTSGSIPRQQLDQYHANAETAMAQLEAALAGLNSSEHNAKASSAEIDRIQSLIDESDIKAPIRGRIQFRLTEPGEVLGPGGRVFTILDPEDVYMTIFLPTADAGKIATGTEARIVVDAYPNIVIPAYVSFVASEAQFTPREVETRSEREKLMFRVKVRIRRELLVSRPDLARPGLPGISYVKLDSDKPWPDSLALTQPFAKAIPVNHP